MVVQGDSRNDINELQEFLDIAMANLLSARDEIHAARTIADELGFDVVEYLNVVAWDIAAARVAADDAKKEIQRLLLECEQKRAREVIISA